MTAASIVVHAQLYQLTIPPLGEVEVGTGGVPLNYWMHAYSAPFPRVGKAAYRAILPGPAATCSPFSGRVDEKVPLLGHWLLLNLVILPAIVHARTECR